MKVEDVLFIWEMSDEVCKTQKLRMEWTKREFATYADVTMSRASEILDIILSNLDVIGHYGNTKIHEIIGV
tara:strand:+ start:130 stop:342 length:213 start_codon:yes stop_codon:yes gene_type:complete